MSSTRACEQVGPVRGDEIVLAREAIVVKREDHLRTHLPCTPETERSDRAVAA